MRPGSNKRMRGRNRRGPNPLARSYKSNGPDVKVRGTAQHIADRYLQLARDAQSSGDPVLAESYFQYAEHYLRIIAAAQEQMQGQYGYRPRPENGAEEEGEGDEGEGDGFSGQPYGGQANGGFNGQPHQMQRGANGNPPIGNDEQPPMFSPPPREQRFDNRNQRFGDRDRDREGWNRQNRNDNRNDGNRSDGNRSDHRRDNYRREGSQEGSPEFSGEPRQQHQQHQPRGGQEARGGGHAEGGNEQHGSEPRRFQGGEGRSHDRPQRERFERAPRPAAPEEQMLPSFITAPARAAPPATESVADEPVEARDVRSEALVEELVAPAAETAAPAPKPRRGRPRRVVEAAQPAPDEAATPGDDTSPIAAK